MPLTPFNNCPSCRHPVSRHQRVVYNNLIPTHNNDSPSIPSSPLSVQEESSILIPSNSNKVSELFKFIPSLPKWNKETGNCNDFLDHIERVLNLSNVSKNAWYRILPLLFQQQDNASSKWVSKHIVDISPTTWKEACTIFTSHFQRADHHQTLQRKFQYCKHQPRESVQEYADRFTSLCEELSIDDNSTLAIAHFLNHLSDRMRSKYQNTLAVLKHSTTDVDSITTSLKKLIEVCVALDIADGSTFSSNPPSISSIHLHNNNHFSSHKKISCRFHPNSTTHSTHECTLNQSQKPTNNNPQKSYSSNFKPTYNKPSTSSNYPSKNLSSITCYACGQSGHYKGDSRCSMASKNNTSNQSNNSNYTKTTSTNHQPFTSRPPLISMNNNNTPRSINNNTNNNNRVNMITTTNEQSTSSVVNPNEDSVSTINNINLTTNTINRTIPLRSVVSSLQDELVFCVNNHRLCRTLLDTGSDISMIDERLVDELKLSTTPSNGVLQLAIFGITAPKSAITSPLNITAIFHSPTVISSSSTPITNNTHTPINFSSSFEVTPFPDIDVNFIIGMDLLPFLFGDVIPLRFCRKSNSIPTINNLNEQSSSTCMVRSKSCAKGNELAEELGHELGHELAEELAEELATELGNQTTILNVNKQHSNNDRNTGIKSIDQIPDSEGTFTLASKEQEYYIRREKLINDPDIQDALQRNNMIHGFCTIPESTLHLEVKSGTTPSELRRRQYRVPQQLTERVDVIIQRWLSEGKIRPAPPGCPYNNSLVVAPKKDEQGNLLDIRVCLDTRALNQALVTEDSFALPYIRVALEIFGNCNMFGEFDLSEAYLQFKVDEQSQPLTAFTWQNKQYVFVGCPFGLSVLPSHFQRVMAYIFSDLAFTFPYMDNLPFGSEDWEQHRQHALIIIERLNSVNLKIKPASIKFGHSHIRCLGHLISSAGIGMDPKKLDALKSWELPKSGPELQTFLGFVTFLRQHVRHFAELTGPLEEVKLLKDIVWTDTLRESFYATKEALLRAPFLQYPDYSKPFHIATDASNTGVGGVLYQPNSKDEHITANNIVGICSKKLSKSQRNYSAYKKELWGIVYSLRQFRPYVWGRKDLVIVTDHKPLIYILSTNEATGSLQLWLDDILDYTFKVIHRPGLLNVMPDALSRMYASLYPTVWGVPSNDINHMNVNITFEPSTTISNVSNITTTTTLKGEESSNTNMLDEHNTTAILQEDTESSTANLLTEMEKRGMKSPPISERLELIRKEHLFGHFGREAIFKSLFNKQIWWPKMREDIQSIISDCDACNRFVVVKAGYNPAQFIHASGPWEHIQLDTSVHLPQSPDGYTALLVIIDVFTGYVILKPVHTTTAEIIARKLWKVFCILGLPKIIQSDNGPEFVNDIMRILIKLTGIDHRLISPYNPRADGKVERSIGSVMSIIKKLLHGSERHWPLFVPFAQLSFNRKITSLTGSSPFSLMFGRAPNEPIDYTNEKPNTISLDNWQQHQEKIVSLIYPSIGKRILDNKDKMIKAINKHRRVLLGEKIPVGSIVMLKDPIRRDKFEPKYIGPYTVIRRSHNGQFVLKDATGDLLDRHVPMDQLKLISKKARSKDNANEVFEVNTILDHRGEPGTYEYLVSWKNYDSSHNTWEPSTNFLDDTVIRNYWKQHGNKPKTNDQHQA